MKVAIIGAGLSGLVCARSLVASGNEVTVFEKSRGLGGRIASRRVEGTVVDHGIPALWSDGPLRDLTSELSEQPVEISLPIGEAEGGRESGAPAAYPDGLTRLAKQLAEDLDVRLSVRIARIRPLDEAIELGDEQGNGHGRFDRLVISAPAPQAADLLEGVDGEQDRAATLRSLDYAPAIIVIAGLRLPAHPPWFGTRHAAADGLNWVGIESAKGRPVPDGAVPVVAHLSSGLSARLFDAPDQDVLEKALPMLVELLGSGASDPAWWQIKRWRYSVPTARLGYEEMNPRGARIFVCGDAVASAFTLDAVLETGQETARRITES